MDIRENNVSLLGCADESRRSTIHHFTYKYLLLLDMCPGRVLFSLAPPTEHITLMKPKAMAYGGVVKEKDVNIPSRVLAKDDPDRVLTRLMPGELVIPLPHVKPVMKFLKSQRIILPGM